MTKFQHFCHRWHSGCGSDACPSARSIVLCRGTVPCDVLFVGEAPGESEDVLGRPFVGPAGKLLDVIIDRSGLNGTMLAEGEYSKDDQPTRCAFTNLVCCIPREATLCPECANGKVTRHCDDGDGHVDTFEDECTNCQGKGIVQGSGKAAEPLPEHIYQCSKRLLEFIDLCSPRLIVCVGGLARDFLDTNNRRNVWNGGDARVAASRLALLPQIDLVHPAAILRANLAQRGLMIQRCVVQLANAVEEHLQ